MSILISAKRPMVRFDVTDLEHRKLYANFMKDRTWGKCPVRFEIEPEWTDLIAMIENKLLKFYFKQEFGQ